MTPPKDGWRRVGTIGNNYGNLDIAATDGAWWWDIDDEFGRRKPEQISESLYRELVKHAEATDEEAA